MAMKTIIISYGAVSVNVKLINFTYVHHLC